MPTDQERAIHQYLNTMFGEQRGQVYVPTKGPEAKSWVRHFFSWPAGCDEIIKHMVQANQAKKDVYIAPALFKTNDDATKENWLGSQYVVVDFDGNAPDELPLGIPEPTIRIQSSTQGHEHWYWKLDNFYEGKANRKAIEGISRNLTYTLDGDKSGWDCNQVLRAPGTRHRRSGATTSVRFLELDRVYGFESFGDLIAIPEADLRIKLEESELPTLIEVLSQVTLNPVAQEIFNRTKQELTESRSDGMFRFAMECLETKPTIKHDQILTMMNHLALLWDKWAEHSDRFLEVKRCLQSALAKHQTKRVDEIDDEYIDFKIITLREFLASANDDFDWHLTNFMLKNTVSAIASPSTAGKTSLVLQMMYSLALQQDFLTFKFNGDDPVRSALLSLEMPNTLLENYTKGLLKSYTPIEQEKILESISIFGRGYGIEIMQQDELRDFILQQIDLNNLNLLVIDSAKYVGVDGDFIKPFFSWAKNELIGKRNLALYLIHHTRKPPSDKPEREPKSLDELYGNSYLGNSCDTVNLLYRNPETNIVTLRNVKARHPTFELCSLMRDDESYRYIVLEDSNPLGETNAVPRREAGPASTFSG